MVALKGAMFDPQRQATLVLWYAQKKNRQVINTKPGG